MIITERLIDLFVCRTGVLELFIDEIEAIRSQLKAICRRLDRAACFAQNIRAARSAKTYVQGGNVLANTKLKYGIDTSLGHVDA